MSSERYRQVKGIIMAGGNSLSEEVKAEAKKVILGMIKGTGFCSPIKGDTG